MALSNIKRVEMGGGLSMIVGDITHTEGAANESYGIAGGRVLGFQVLKNTSTDIADITGNCPVSWVLSSGILTITIAGISEIAAGSFWIIVGN